MVWCSPISIQETIRTSPRARRFVAMKYWKAWSTSPIRRAHSSTSPYFDQSLTPSMRKTRRSWNDFPRHGTQSSSFAFGSHGSRWNRRANSTIHLPFLLCTGTRLVDVRLRRNSSFSSPLRWSIRSSWTLTLWHILLYWLVSGIFQKKCWMLTASALSRANRRFVRPDLCRARFQRLSILPWANSSIVQRSYRFWTHSNLTLHSSSSRLFFGSLNTTSTIARLARQLRHWKLRRSVSEISKVLFVKRTAMLRISSKVLV